MGYLSDNGEKSMRRLGFVWAMSLLTIALIAHLFGIAINVQIFIAISGIATVAIGASAIKNKVKVGGSNRIPFEE